MPTKHALAAHSTSWRATFIIVGAAVATLVRCGRARVLVTALFVLGPALSSVGGCATPNAERLGTDSARVVRCDAGSGWCTEQSTWDGGYNVIDHQCHHAACNGVEAGSDGILACSGNTQGYGGHTINWSSPEPGRICLSEPQTPGGEACCFDGSVSDGLPDMTSDFAYGCFQEMCPPDFTPVALEAGVRWPHEYLDCAAASGDNASQCISCCTTNANVVFTTDDAGADGGLNGQRNDAFQRCVQACGIRCESYGRNECIDKGCTWSNEAELADWCGYPTRL